MRLLANLHKQIKQRLDHVSSKLKFLQILGFLKKILEGQNEMNGGDRPPIALVFVQF